MSVDPLVFLRFKFVTDFTRVAKVGIPLGKPSVCILRCCRLSHGHGGRRDIHRVEKTRTHAENEHQSRAQGGRSGASLSNDLFTTKCKSLSLKGQLLDQQAAADAGHAYWLYTADGHSGAHSSP